VLKQAPCCEDVIGGSEGIPPSILNLRLDRDKLWASCPSFFTLMERAPGTHLIGGWVGPKVSMDVVMKRKVPAPAGN